jgi:hypothetical protein
MRKIIWHYTVDRDIDLCNVENSTDFRHGLLIPKLNLLLTCRQINRGYRSLDIRYRFIIDRFGSCRILYHYLKPELLQESQFVIKKVLFNVVREKVHPYWTKAWNSSRLEDADEICGTSMGSCKSVQVKNIEEPDETGWASWIWSLLFRNTSNLTAER